METTTNIAAKESPTNTTSPELAQFVMLAFSMVQLHFNRGRNAWFFAGMWLYRLKKRLGHGTFTVELSRYAGEWGTSVETLRRRMHFYRRVRKGLMLRYIGKETTAQIQARIASLEEVAGEASAADEKVAELEAEIKTTAEKAIAAHRAHGRPVAVSLKVEGLTASQHKFLLTVTKRLKAYFDQKKFNEKILEFLGSWAQELPPESRNERRHRTLAARKTRKNSMSRPRDDNSAPFVDAANQKPKRRPSLRFASEEDVLS